jgi:hypothetical protein
VTVADVARDAVLSLGGPCFPTFVAVIGANVGRDIAARRRAAGDRVGRGKDASESPHRRDVSVLTRHTIGGTLAECPKLASMTMTSVRRAWRRSRRGSGAT